LVKCETGKGDDLQINASGPKKYRSEEKVGVRLWGIRFHLEVAGTGGWGTGLEKLI